MGDDSSKSIVKSLKKEWALLFEVFHQDENTEADKNRNGTRSESSFEGSGIGMMSRETVRQLTKKLTEDRKKLNQQLEFLTKELEVSSAKLECLFLVGADATNTLKRIEELNDLGLSLTESLAKIEHNLGEVRSKELDFREAGI
jgi:hypothetical protein